MSTCERRKGTAFAQVVGRKKTHAVINKDAAHNTTDTHNKRHPGCFFTPVHHTCKAYTANIYRHMHVD